MRGIPLVVGTLTAALITTIGLTEPPVLWLIGVPLVVALAVLGRRFDVRLNRTREPLSGGSLFAMTAVFLAFPLVIMSQLEGLTVVFPVLGAAAGIGVWLYFRRLVNHHDAVVDGVKYDLAEQ